jgi:hypothetical protein
MDSLAALAATNADTVRTLRESVQCESSALTAFWDSVVANVAATERALEVNQQPPAPQFLILIECRDEQHQLELLEKLHADGVPCKSSRARYMPTWRGNRMCRWRRSERNCRNST